MSSGARLVTRSVRPGASVSSSLSIGAASSSCSNCRARAAPAGRAGRRPAPRAVRVPASRPGRAHPRSSVATRSASLIGASSTSTTPPGNSASRPVVASTASRVFPVPAGPVRVRRRTSASPSSARISRCSRLRPTNEVDRARSLGAGRASGAAVRRPAPDPDRGSPARGCVTPTPARSRAARPGWPWPPVGVQCLRLPARAVEREHQLAAQALRQRVLGDQALELSDELGVRGRARDPRRCDPGARRGEAPRSRSISPCAHDS